MTFINRAAKCWKYCMGHFIYVIYGLFSTLFTYLLVTTSNIELLIYVLFNTLNHLNEEAYK